MNKHEIEAALEGYRKQIDALNHGLVDVSNKAAAFMREHCKVKVGDVVWWLREGHKPVKVKVSYIEMLSTRFMMSTIERPPVRGFVVLSNGATENVERHIYSHYRRMDEGNETKVRQRPTGREPDGVAEAILREAETVQNNQVVIPSPGTARARVRPGTPVQPASPPTALLRVRRRPS